MSTYGTMITRVADELAFPAVVARIPNAIQAATRFYESERFWFNEGESTASTVADQQAYAMPTDFLEAESLTLTDSSVRYPIKRRPWSWMRRNNLITSVTARPCDWAYFADQIFLYPIPDAVYTLTISFLKRQSAISAYTDTNDWMVHGEELIRERAKYDLMRQGPARDLEMAGVLKGCVEEALSNLRAKSEQKIATPRLSLDGALTAGGDGYNINWQ
ncbi:MAG: phage adaptor protein [Alphaproteobacteria bacterium]